MRRAEIVKASKYLVDALLEMNTRNRKVRPAVVQRYRRDIASGNWFLTNQGIGVSECGVLMDGQHRLLAIKEEGYPPVPLLVVYGLDLDSQLVIDQQAKRSARDILSFAFDARVSRMAPAIGNVILKQINKQGGYHPTINELFECIEQYQDEIEFILSIPSNVGFFAAPFYAAFVELAKDQDKEKIRQFMLSTESGEMLERDMPQYHLRNFIITGKSMSGGGAMQTERYKKAFKAATAYIEGQKMKTLRADKV